VTELDHAAALAYASEHTTGWDGQLAEIAAWTQANTDAPQMMAGVAEARLLQSLIVAGGAQQVLEIGTFTGLGALAMAAALRPGGRVTTLEVDPERAARAQQFFDQSPVGERIELIVGPALDRLEELSGPFDLVWIDALKSEYPAYYDAVVPKLAERGVIVADNLFRAGRALDPQPGDEMSAGIRAFARRVQDDDRVDNVLLTVGDGLMLAWPRPGAPA
jgi:caffeoyl-CoA O-methyltransferase